MHARISSNLLLALATLAGVVCAEDKEQPDKTVSTTSSVITPCVATSTSGSFFDLRPDTAVAVAEGEKAPRGIPVEDYLAKGWDYGANFTLNICSAVVKKVDDVVGVEKAMWRNVSAYYESKGKVYSLGFESGKLVPRGRKLVLEYTGGSPCGSPEDKKKDKRSGSVHDGAAYKYYGDDEDDTYEVTPAAKKEDAKEGTKDEKKDKDNEEKQKEKDKEKEKEKSLRHKSAIISFLCGPDPDTPTAASFVATDQDECVYFFEVRSQHACATAEPHTPGSVGPGSVFAIIFFIAVLVYVVGGIFYQRTVAHARGWRQLPNYSMWAGMWNFVRDIFIILTSSCARFLPSRRGYRSLSISPNGRQRNREDENRLIDQLDEEWDD
ncbi:mannose-6-phosphate receptor binding domain-containing protein [Lasiosphaeria miniovina]|uniref:Mannose-6-phosphate receptor binding domain-containing protein n=1 Tax=Lasiosphaeria miniovina TaxID=1954250 RepID=A0AA40AM86_9PEZI|nr:mannose-6-phosphate receptor binding domain-containing protein [Lasiosphaeria miniovina]KAK0718451.1 mannose-6-phosphate receptor binding domain-containing protein [Lasiosphaeria miniovina]